MSADAAQNAVKLVADCAPYLKDGQTPAERMAQDQADILALMKLLEKTKWALQDAVSTNAENCRQRDWWKRAHSEVEAELTANEGMVGKLTDAMKDAVWGLETAKNALSWAGRRMASPEYGNVVKNDARNASIVFERASDFLKRVASE